MSRVRLRRLLPVWSNDQTAVILALGSALLLFHNVEKENPQLRIDNPLAVGTALKLAAFIAMIMLALGLLREAFGSIGALIVAALSGTADVDAATISLARLTGMDVDASTAALGILFAVAVNTMSKSVLAGWTGEISIVNENWKFMVPVGHAASVTGLIEGRFTDLSEFGSAYSLTQVLVS